jgi:succinate dehydrogenase hydrophobic membrane anchor protein
VLGFFVANPELTHSRTGRLLRSTVMVLFSTLTLLATAAHAWIGMWTVGTDYVRPHYFGAHATSWRLGLPGRCLSVLFVYVVWALQSSGVFESMAKMRKMTFDGVIVGGGGSGMRAALQLAQSG